MSLGRRKFLKIGTALSLLPLSSSLLGKEAAQSKVNLGLVKNGSVVTAAHWGILKLTIKDGIVVKSEPYDKLTKTDNPLWYYTPDMIYKSRVRFAYVRKSYLQNPDSPKPELRGKEEFVRVSYEEAIKLIAKELKKTRDEKGSAGVFAGSYGWKSTGNMQNSRILLHRFMNLTGGFVGVLGDYSTGASQVIMPYVVGSMEVYEQQTSWENILSKSKVVVIWGADPLSTLRISWTANEQKGIEYFEKLRDSKIKVICIDPIRTDTAKFLKAEWIAVRPNTDVAMMMGMASHLIATNKVNYNFLENYTTGFDKFKAYLEGKEDGIIKDAAWASKICGIDEKIIKKLAEQFYDNATMIMSGWGMQRAHHGEQPHWMLVTLCAMLGQIGTKGGGFGLSYHYSGGGVPTCKGGVIGGMSAGGVGIWKNDKFMGVAKSEAQAGAEWLQNTASHAFPLARIADALLNPGKTIEHNGEKITYPDIDFIYWVGGNPIVHHQDTNTNKKAWRKPRTVVVNEIYWTPTAKMADIVMPVTSAYERDDITMAGDYSNMAIVPMKQAVAPLDESRDDYEIFCDLCKVYGGKALYEAYSENGKKAKDFIKEYYESALKQTKAYGEAFATPMPSFEEFWAKNEPVTFEAPIESMEWVRFGDFIEDPILNALGTDSGLIEIYSQKIASYNYDDCKAHPAWFEPIEWLGNASKKAPFHLLTSHPANRLHSQLCHTSLRDKYAVKGREPILINKKDAKKLDIKNGDIVRVFNDRGEILAGAVLSDDILEGVVRVCEGGWVDQDENGLCKMGGVNVLTLDMPTSKLANGNISHTGLVNIEKFKGELPQVTAFSAPKGAI